MLVLGLWRWNFSCVSHDILILGLWLWKFSWASHYRLIIRGHHRLWFSGQKPCARHPILSLIVFGSGLLKKIPNRFSRNGFAQLGLKIFLDGFAYTEENFFTNVARDSMADFAADDVVRLVAGKIRQKKFFYLVSFFFCKKREGQKKVETWEGCKMCI